MTDSYTTTPAGALNASPASSIHRTLRDHATSAVRGPISNPNSTGYDPRLPLPTRTGGEPAR